jgi:hypothetical protein
MAEFYSNFDLGRYSELETGYGGAGENTMANAGLVITFKHVPTGNVVNFKAFITAFNETYNSDWASETVYGRGDPIYLFKNTTRKITLAFKVPAITEGEAYENLGKVQMLTQFLYPTYKNTGQANTITQSPLVRIQMLNLVQNSNETTRTGESYAEIYNNYTKSGEGLLGAIGNLTVNHNLDGDHGVITKNDGTAAQALLPKLIEINLDFSPIHEHSLGWDYDNKFGQGQVQGDSGNGEFFPYGVKLYDNSPEAAASDQAQETAGGDDGLSDDLEDLTAGEENANGDPAAPDPDAVESAGAAAEAAVAAEYAQALANLNLSEAVEDITGPDNSASGIEAREKAETRARLEENMQAIREALE